LSEDFIIKHQEKLNLIVIATYQKLSIDFINKNKNIFDLSLIFSYQKINLKLLKENEDSIHFEMLSENNNLTEDIVDEYLYKLNMEKISKKIKLSYEFIKENKSCIYMDNILVNENMEVETLRKLSGDFNSLGILKILSSESENNLKEDMIIDTYFNLYKIFGNKIYNNIPNRSKGFENFKKLVENFDIKITNKKYEEYNYKKVKKIINRKTNLVDLKKLKKKSRKIKIMLKNKKERKKEKVKIKRELIKSQNNDEFTIF